MKQEYDDAKGRPAAWYRNATGHVILERGAGVGKQRIEAVPEPNCAVCGSPIRWVLDMFSFTSGFEEPRFTLAHARCVWKDTAFYDQAKFASKDAEST